MKPSMYKEAKEGDPIPGGYALTELGADTLNSLRSREAKGDRATALEKMALAYTFIDQKKAWELMKMNDADIQEIFDGQRRSLSYDEIRELKAREEAEMVITRKEPE